MTKKELRKSFLAKRMSIAPQEKLKWDDLLLVNFQRLKLDETNTLFTYFPADKFNEPNTIAFTNYLRFIFPHIEIAYPRVNTVTQEMQAVRITEDTKYMVNTYGIREPDGSEIIAPTSIDMIFVPLLAFDTDGYRVGFGKGYYDKYLANCREDVFKIGFSYFDAVNEIEDIHENDVPLDCCVTVNTLYAFGQ